MSGRCTNVGTIAAMLFALLPHFSTAAELGLRFVIGGKELPLDITTVTESSANSTLCHLDDPNRTCITVRLSRAAKDALAEMTTANVGTPLYVMLGDRVISAAILREPILGGTARIVADVKDVPTLLEAMR